MDKAVTVKAGSGIGDIILTMPDPAFAVTFREPLQDLIPLL